MPPAERVDPDLVRRWWGEHRSSFAVLLGFAIDDVGDGSATLRLPYAPQLCNEGGAIHGGAIASLCDSAMYVALISAFGTAAQLVTVDLNVSFLAPAAQGSDLVAFARTIKAGRSISFGDVSVAAGTRTVAHATLNYINVDRR